ncbi:MAG: hypothetical protein RIS47_2141 [Bacteroidota bacterium]|jgi:dUTP pyrophosphatase
MEVKVINRSSNLLPAYASVAAAGTDICSNLDADVVLRPLQRALIPTGLFVSIPVGYEIQIRPRSGLAFKYGITVLNSPGTIDADYRGEIKVLLVNLSDTEFTIHHGERIAQMVLASHEQINWSLVASLDDTARGEGGFGHTGI